MKPTMRQPEFGITVDNLRSMTKSERGEIISRKVGEALCHKIPHWPPEGKEELRETLSLLIDDLRNRLSEEGIERKLADQFDSVSLPKRVRRDAASVAALIAFIIPFIDGSEEQLSLVNEGIDWTHISGDTYQEGILYYVRAGVYSMEHRMEELIADYRHGIDAAQRGAHLPLELLLRSSLTESLLRMKQMDDVEEEVERMSAIVEKIEDPEEKRYYRSRLLRFQGDARLAKDDLFNGITLLQKARTELSDETSYPTDIGPILFRLAGAYHNLGQTEQAIDLLLDMVEICVKGKELVPAIHAYARIGELRMEINEIEGAKEAFEFAERYLSVVSMKDAEHIVRYRKLPLYLKTEEYEEGIQSALDVLQYYQNNPTLRQGTLHVLGQLFEKRGDIESAEEILRNGFGIAREVSGRRIGIGYSLARLLHTQGKSEQARELLLSITDSEPRNYAESKSYADCLDLLASIEEERENYSAANTYLRRVATHRSETEGREREALRRNAQISSDLRLQESQKGMERLVRHRTELELAEILTGLQKSYGSLARIEKNIVDGLDWLTTEEIRRVIDILKEAISEPETRRTIFNISAEVGAIEQLEEVDEKFFEALNERWPKLTTTQQQLCGMIRAGLQTPEIANLLEITHNAVWKKRKRLRKKMNLGEEESLEGVIAEVGQGKREPSKEERQK